MLCGVNLKAILHVHASAGRGVLDCGEVNEKPGRDLVCEPPEVFPRFPRRWIPVWSGSSRCWNNSEMDCGAKEEFIITHGESKSIENSEQLSQQGSSPVLKSSHPETFRCVSSTTHLNQVRGLFLGPC